MMLRVLAPFLRPGRPDDFAKGSSLPVPSDSSADLPRLVAATLNRLRLIQIDFADSQGEVRQGHMTGEVSQALVRLPASSHESFLHQIRERFPDWKGEARSLTNDSASQKTIHTIETNGPEALLEQLIALAPALSEDQRKAISLRLREAGLAESGPPPEWPAAAARAIKTKLQLTDRDSLDPVRLLELMTELVGFASSLDQLVWATWKQVAPKSDIKRPTPIQRSCARFVSGQQDSAAGPASGSREQVAVDLDRLRQLTASLISAIAQAGNLFAQKHVAKFAVANIETYADKMPGMIVNKEVKCWRQYKELAAAMDAHAIELELQNGIAEYTETLIKGRSRT
jgi:hypothetical protein